MAFAVVAALVALPGTAVGDAQAADGGIVFEPATPLELEASVFSAGVTLKVRNTTSGPIDIGFVLTPFRRNGDRIEPGDVATVSPESAHVTAGDVVEVTVKGTRGARLAAGTYNGALLATTETPPQLARRSLAIAIGAAAGAEAEPLVSTVTATVYRNRGLDWNRYPSPDEIVIPLKTTTDRVAVVSGDEFGGIGRGTDAVAVLADGPRTVRLPSGRRGLGIHLTRLGEVGDYEGKIDLLPTDEKAGDVTLKVTYKDAIWLPLFWLSLGVGAGYLVSRLLGVTLRYYGLRADLGLLRRAIDEASVAFAAKASSKDWRAYAIRNAGAAKLAELKARADDLRDEYRMKIPDEPIKELRDAIKAARTTTTGFATFADELTALNTSVSKIKQPTEPLPETQPGSGTPLPDRPRILEELEPLLRGHEFATLEDLDARRQKVQQADEAATKWLDVRGEISRRHQTLRKINDRGVPPGKADAFHTAEVAALGAYSALLTDVNISRARSDGLGAMLEHLRDLVDDLYEPDGVGGPEGGREVLAPPPPGTDSAEAGAGPLAEPAGLLGQAWLILSNLMGRLWRWIKLRPWWVDDYARFTLWRRAQSFLLLVLALAVAIASGLNSVYVGKAFGTWWDYINLFIWGLTTKLVFDLVVGSLDSLGVLRLARR
jgi:hypothetical protein